MVSNSIEQVEKLQNMLLDRQYLRQKMKECRAFEVELLSTKTDDSDPQKAHERYCSTFKLSDPVYVEDDTAATEPYSFRGVVYPGSSDDVEHCTLDRTRGQLSNGATLVSHAVGLGDDLVDHRAGLSAETGRRISVGRRRSRD